ncbi:MAG: hypothetical protein GWN00_02515, partial [Aliifodinibius sp.]|nr:hypothetical protein [candidate division Zixibacteria bacterium]NIT55144.1 hypothetical protein [Fodinibius sp.]NIS44661.1 hypothetical protein [candidate division Zixibacteria bacterium]NIU12718.1 hypothetical protein [candidate division Zixibacteria bacterium]NIV04823.1 hypothetical protein [candidate division Zixibacteria bacterium]
MKYWCQFILAIFLVMLMTGFGMSQITTYPYVVDFENGGNIPPGWINDPNDSGKDWDFDTDAGHGAGFDHTTGSGYLAYVDDSFPHETDPTNLLSDTLDLTGLTSPTLSFWYWSFNDRSTPSEFAYLHIDVWDGSTWHMDVTDSIGQEAPEWRKRTVDLTPYQSAQTVVRFRVLETSSFYHDIGIDDVRVGEPQTDLTVSQFINFPSSAVANSTVNFDIEVSNVGATTITSDSLDLYLNGSLVSSFEYSTLSIGEKDTIAASVTASASGRDSVVAAVRLVSGDNNPANDTLGAAYTVLSTLPVPFTEMWDTTTFDPQKWPDITGSPEIIDSTGVSTGTFPYPVPSEPYFLSVNGDPVEVTSGFFDLSGVTDYVIALSESEHDLEPPESVALEYYSSGGTWEMLHLFEGTNNGFGTFEPFEQMAFLLPSDAYHGSFRFRFRGVDGLESTDEWFFDNIHLFSADSLASDIAALQLNQPQLTQLAQSQTGTTSGVVSEGWYRNFGPTNTGDVNVEITDDVGTSVFSDAITGVTIDPLSDTTFTFSAWDASGAAAGNYNIMTYTSNFNDGNSANDSAFASLELNKTMAYDDGNHTNNVAIISSGRSILGTRFTLTDDDTLTSVSMQITSSTIASDSFSIDIYEAAGDTPTVALARIFRGTYQDVSPLPALVQFAIAGTGLPLTAGDYYAIIDSDSSGNSNFPLGVSSSGLGAEYIPRRFGGASPGFNNGAWNFFEDVPNPVFATFTPIIRIGLQESVIHDYAVTEVFAEPCLLYNSTNTVYARVTNRGSEPESNVTVELWENGVFVSDALVSLNAGETDSVAFAYTPSDTGVVELKVVSMLSTDNYTINDTSTTYTRVTDTDALVFQDDFTDTTFTFSNWVITNDGGTDVWMVFEEPYPNSYTLPMTSSGNVLSADADEAGSGSSTLTTAIISLDLSAYDSVRLDFDSDWNAGGSDDTARVKISPDGGTTWITVLEYDGTDQRNEHLSLDLSGDLANAANAMIAFQSIQPGWDWWWTIDNVCVTGATVTPTAALPFWEGFNDTTLQIPQGWIQIDADGGDEIPGADWHLRGDTVSNVFPFEGAGYAANNFQAANSNGVIDEWLISPQFQSYQDGMELSFYLNHVDDIWDDSVMVLVSTGSSDPNDFTQIDYINCPITWTEFSYNLSNHGVSPGDNFYIAFRYLHFDGGSFGNNSNFFGLEDMHIDFPPAPPASKLLLSEIVVTPTEGEFVEIYNPNPDSVDLTNYYITDATFASGNTYYYQIVQGGGGGGGFADWHARFPAGAMIGPDEYQTIALAGDSLFFDLYNELPTYELFEDSTNFANDVPDMLEATPGSINNQGGLTNGDEMVVLY